MLLLVVSFSLLFGSFKVKGEGPYIVENLLNLSNIIISPMPDSTGPHIILVVLSQLNYNKESLYFYNR